MADQVFEQVMASLGLPARGQQTQLVALIRGATGQTMFAQAGTGVGKSFVLLSAAIERRRATGRSSVIVCPTNALVDQYVHKDAPRVCEAAGASFTHLKGRSHYLCASSKALSAMGGVAGEEAFQHHLDRAGTADLDVLGLDSEQWGCPGSKRCAGGTCGALLARAAAAKFDVVITNAHVLVWDLRVRDWTGGQVALLPEYGGLFVDECHELDAAGRSCLSDQIGPRSKLYGLVPGLSPWIRRRVASMRDDRLSETLFDPDAQVLGWRDRIQVQADAIREQIEDEQSNEPADWDQIKHWRTELETHDRFLDLFRDRDDDGARFITTVDSDGNLNRQCVDASILLGRILSAQTSVLVSGTVPGSLPYRLGTSSLRVTDVGHPFTYGNSRLAISRHNAKDPSKFTRSQRIDQLVRAITQTGGGTLVLFTSWADLHEVMPKVQARLPVRLDGGGQPQTIPVFMQSREDPATLKQDVADFAAHGNAVLAGVRSLFTGIDVPGPALRQVVLWKLPYPVPTLEVQAIQAIHGPQVYRDQMLTSLAQGAGRLVRTVDDRGRVLILDSRARGQNWRASTLTRHLADFQYAS